MTEIRFDAQRFDILASEDNTQPSRSIIGVAVPWNVTANASTGPVRFLEGSLPVDGPAPKLLRDHDPTQPIGIVAERVSTSDGMMFTARISETAAGNEALVLAADGVLDAVSVGAVPTDFEWDGNVMVVKAAQWRELSVLPFGAFDSARIHQVAAEAADEAVDADESPEPDPETQTQEEEADAVTEATIPTNPIVVAAAPAITRPRISAAEAVSGIICGKRDILEVLAADNLLSDVPGLLPEPLIGDVWDTTYASRPIIDAVGTRALPSSGEIFFRRYIDSHTAVAQQINQLDNLASAPLVVERLQFDKKTFGGYVNVSSQAGDWTDPALVQAIINDMIRMYAKATEAYVAGRIDNAAGAASTLITDPADGDEVIAALYDGAAELRSATGELPTHIIVNSACWAKFGQAKDAGGNRIFPYLGPVNAAGMSAGAATFGMSPLGLSLIVSDDVSFAAGNYQALIMYAPAVEVYEDRSRTGGIRVENAATASAQLGLWGYVAADVLPPVSGGGSYVKSLFAA